MSACFFCRRRLTNREIESGNVCGACSDERRGLPRQSKSAAFLAAHPGLRAFKREFTRSLASDAQEAAMAFNRSRARAKAQIAAEHSPNRLDRLYR